jgi:hypothetical protein
MTGRCKLKELGSEKSARLKLIKIMICSVCENVFPEKSIKPFPVAANGIVLRSYYPGKTTNYENHCNIKRCAFVCVMQEEQ